MKKQLIPHGMEKRDKNQEMISSLKDDLITVLESYMEELGVEETFYTALRFMTVALYETTDSHKAALSVLKMAMDHGIHAVLKEEGK